MHGNNLDELVTADAAKAFAMTARRPGGRQRLQYPSLRIQACGSKCADPSVRIQVCGIQVCGIHVCGIQVFDQPELTPLDGR